MPVKTLKMLKAPDNAPVTNKELSPDGEFLGDFDSTVRGQHGNHLVAVQFERWQFNFETPSCALSWFRKKKL